MVRSQAASFTIGKLAQAGSVGVETIRYYQRRGLLGTPDKGANTTATRRYGAEDLRRLRFIRTARAAGFTLEQIGELLLLDASHDRVRARDLANERVAALNAKIAELVAARDALQHLAQACGASDHGPCPIITAFDRDRDSSEASLGERREQVKRGAGLNDQHLHPTAGEIPSPSA